MKIWSGESDETVYDLTEDQFYVRIDDENGVLRINDNEANGSHMTTMLFVGPNSDKNARMWDAYVAIDPENYDFNTNTRSMIRACFGLE
jgi:hypothetical protein